VNATIQAKSLQLILRRQGPSGSTMGISWGYITVPIGSMVLVYMLTLGLYWWDPWHTIYSSTMDPSWGMYYPLVKVYIAIWKDPPLSSWVFIHYFDWAMASIAFCIPEGTRWEYGRQLANYLRLWYSGVNMEDTPQMMINQWMDCGYRFSDKATWCSSREV